MKRELQGEMHTFQHRVRTFLCIWDHISVIVSLYETCRMGFGGDPMPQWIQYAHFSVLSIQCSYLHT